MLRAMLIAVVLLLTCAVGVSEASRAPTYIEKVAIMDAFNVPGRSWPSRCVRIVVSTVDPRYAYLVGPDRPPQVCIRAKEVGNGLVVFRRASRTAIHWRDILEGEGVPCILPPPVRQDFFGTTKCGPSTIGHPYPKKSAN